MTGRYKLTGPMVWGGAVLICAALWAAVFIALWRAL